MAIVEAHPKDGTIEEASSLAIEEARQRGVSIIEASLLAKRLILYVTNKKYTA